MMSESVQHVSKLDVTVSSPCRLPNAAAPAHNTTASNPDVVIGDNVDDGHVDDDCQVNGDSAQVEMVRRHLLRTLDDDRDFRIPLTPACTPLNSSTPQRSPSRTPRYIVYGNSFSDIHQLALTSVSIQKTLFWLFDIY